MYRIYLDDLDHPIWLPAAQDRRWTVLEPKLREEIGKAASLTFRLPPDNAVYGTLTLLRSTVLLFDGDAPVFRGRVLKLQTGLYGDQLVTCEGDLGFLHDSVVPMPFTFDGLDGAFLARIAEIHNGQASADRQLLYADYGGTSELAVEASDCETCFDTLLDNWRHELSAVYGDQEAFLTTEVVPSNGAYASRLTFRAASGGGFTDDVALGENVLDITDLISGEDIYTVIVPLGAQVETGETDRDGNAVRRPLTVAQVNNGSIFIENAAGIASFGRIVKTVRFSDIGPDDDRTEAQAARDLYDAGAEALARGIFAERTIEAAAVDLRQAGLSGSKGLKLGYPTRVVHPGLGLDTTVQCRKISLDLANPERSRYSFGKSRPTITGQTWRDSETAAAALKTAGAAASAAASAYGGVIITRQPADVSGSVGETAVFAVAAVGSGLTYQWQYKSAAGTAWANSGLSGNKTTKLSVPVIAGRNGMSLRCVVTAGSGARATSGAAVLTVI